MGKSFLRCYGGLCNQSAVTMRVGAGLTRIEFTFLFGRGSTGRTCHGKRLFEAEFFHVALIMLRCPCLEWSLLNRFGQSAPFPQR